MSRLNWKDFERLAGEFFANESGIRLLPQWPVHLKNRMTHKFDFSSENERLVVQCKSLTWTKSQHYPSGKVAEAQRAIHMLQESSALRKIVVFDDHLNQKGQSFVEVFVRRNKDSLSGVEVWRHHDGKFELYFGTNDKPNPADVHVVELAIKLLVDLSHRETKERIVSFREIAQRLGNTLETLRSVAGVIETSLKNEGIPAVREGDGFRLRLDL
jgi:hypothetical protein